MTTDHRAEALERLRASDYQRQEGDFKGARLEASAALVHATLADKQDSVRPLLATLVERWEEVVDAYKPADMGGEWDDITRRYQHYRQTYQKAIRDVEFVLDEGKIPCQLMTVEERRRGDCGHAHADDNGRTARKPVAARDDYDPWAASPDITADIPSPVRRVIAGQLASMLLSSDGEAVQAWGRNFATALKNEGADLDDAIKTRIYELTLGHTDMPF